MAIFDNDGLQLSTASDKAGEQYREAVTLALAAWPGAWESVNAAISEDPDFALAHALRARLLTLRAQPTEARATIDEAVRLAGLNSTERERSHIEVLSLAIHSQSSKALARTLDHADQWPADRVVLSLALGAFGLFAFSGMADHNEARVALCERVAGSYGSDDWWFLTYQGWAWAECRSVARGRQTLERAYDLRRENANGVHALTHALFEAGAASDADQLISSWLPTYDRSGLLHGHIAWHAALIALERGDAEGALAIYADHVQPSVSRGMPINIVTDGASLLWRVGAYGHAVPDGLWQTVSDYADDAFPRPGHAFIDTHMLMIAAATGREKELEQRAAALDVLAQSGALGAGTVVPTMGRALEAFARGDYIRCIVLLEPVAHDVVRIGGSGAQREIIEDTLLIAYMRSGDRAKAQSLLNVRLARRPSHRDELWRNQLHS